MNKFKTKRIKDLKVGDTVMGPSGPVTVTKIISKNIPVREFKIKFSGIRGYVKCSSNHIWKVYKDGNSDYLETIFLLNLPNYKEYHIGSEDGPTIKSVKEIKPKEVCCIQVDSEDHLFGITTDDKNCIYTSNCQMRLACGRLGSVASMMLFGSTIGTTINGSIPGQGIVYSNGDRTNVQYYFTEIDFITDFYKKAGFDKTGRRKDKNYVEEEEKEDFEGEFVETSNSDSDDIEDFFEFEKEIEDIELDGVTGTFDKTVKQKFD